MSLSRDLDPGASVLAFFGAELRRCRLAADQSQEQLGQQVSYSAALVGLIENAKRVPSLSFAERCDDALATDGTLARLWPLVSRETLPGWFRPWIEIEREATSLRSFEPLIIPGLLQTPEYARTLLAAQPAGTEDGLEQLVATRMDRQLILSRENPPQLWCLLDEGALHRRVGGAKIMHDQLVHLVPRPVTFACFPSGATPRPEPPLCADDGPGGGARDGCRSGVPALSGRLRSHGRRL